MPALDENEVAVLAELKTSDPALYRKIRSEALKAAAKLHPDVVVPEVELENTLDGMRTEQAKKLADMQAALDAEHAARTKAEAVAAARDVHGLQPDEVPAVEKFMAENKIDDFDTGVRFMRLQEAEAAKIAQAPTSGRMEFAPDFAAALKDRRGVRRKHLFSALNDLRKQERRNAVFATH